MVTAMGQINRPPSDGEKPSELLQRLLEVRADDERRQLAPGEKRHKKSTRPLSSARVKRIMAVLDSALNSAVKSKRMDRNPAANVELPRVSTVRPLVWTKPRVDRRLAKGKVPGPVMVWTPMQTGAFLDFVMDDRLYPLFHLTAFRGLRRAEVAGLPWSELDLDQGPLLTVTETRHDNEEYDDPDDPKSEAGTRTISLDPDTVKILKDWRHDQAKERLAAGQNWVDSGLVFTQPDGRPLRPDGIYRRFDALVSKYEMIRLRHAAGRTIAELARRHRVPEAAARVAAIAPLPPIRFHDLRHGAATLSLAAGVDIKVVSETLGHSKSSFTRDTYTSVIPEVAQAAAEAVVQVVPRMRQLYKQRQQGRERA